MGKCPRCGNPLTAATPFCPHCGHQLRVQTVEGQVMDVAAHPQSRGALPHPLLAAIFSVVPGLGHVYAGAPRRGLLFFIGVLAPEVIGVDLDLTVIGDLIGIPLGAGGLGLWAICALDAYRTAKKRIAEETDS